MEMEGWYVGWQMRVVGKLMLRAGVGGEWREEIGGETGGEGEDEGSKLLLNKQLLKVRDMMSVCGMAVMRAALRCA